METEELKNRINQYLDQLKGQLFSEDSELERAELFREIINEETDLDAMSDWEKKMISDTIQDPEILEEIEKR